MNEKKPLTKEQIDGVIKDLPDEIYRAKEVKRQLRLTCEYIKRGIVIYNDAPVWIQAENMAFIHKIDQDISEK